MAHNPYIFKADDTYVLYYIGSVDGSTQKRAVGYAYSKSLTGDWTRSDKAINLPDNSNNPAIIQTDDGSTLTLQRRERPFCFEDSDKKYLFTTAKCGGPDQVTGGKTWNMVQEIKSINIK